MNIYDLIIINKNLLLNKIKKINKKIRIIISYNLIIL